MGHDIVPKLPGGPPCQRLRLETLGPKGRIAHPEALREAADATRQAGPGGRPRRPETPAAKTKQGFDPRVTCHGLTGWEGGKEMAMDTVASKFQQRWTIFSATKRMLSPPPPPFRFSVLGGGGHNNTLVPLGVHQGPRTVYDTG